MADQNIIDNAADEEENFMTVKDLKKILNDLPDNMEVMSVVEFPPDDDNKEEEDRTLYIPISGVEDITDDETQEKAIGLVIDLTSELGDDDDEEEEEPVDAGD